MNMSLTRRDLLGGGAVLVGGQLIAPFPGVEPAPAVKPSPKVELVGNEARVSTVGDVQLKRIHHDENLLPDREHSGFCSLVHDSDGKLVLHDGDKTWLYTTALFEAPDGEQRDWYGKWVSHVREFNTKSLVSGEKKLALGLAGNDQWAVIHNVIKVSDSLYVAVYSTNLGVRAAVSSCPDGVFQADPDFRLDVTEVWEKKGGKEDSLESTGGHVKIEDTDDHLLLWLLYDSYHVDKTRGLLGWAKVHVDKGTCRVELRGKHPDNPLSLLPSKGYIAARAGGNLSSDVRLGGKHTMFYYSRANQNEIMLTAGLSSDALFQDVTDVVEMEPPLGTEDVIEKFESYMVNNVLHIIYENNLASSHWGTGIRLYRMGE